MLEDYSQEKQKELAFQIVVALRDTISIAKKIESKPTYENAIRILHDISPELYEEVIKQLPNKNLSENAKFYQGKAELQSFVEQKQISPVDLIQNDINEIRGVLGKSELYTSNKKNNLLQRIIQLEATKANLKPRQISMSSNLVDDNLVIRFRTKPSQKRFMTSVDEDNCGMTATSIIAN